MKRTTTPRLLVWFVVGLCAAVGTSLVVRDMRVRPATPLAEEWDYGRIASVPVLYEPAREIPVPLAQARGLAESEGFLYVCGDTAVVKLDSRGTETQRYNFESGPRCLAAAPGERLYVGMTQQVVVLDTRTGEQAGWSDLGEQAIVTSIAVDSDGEQILVADAGNRQVLRFDRHGKLLGYAAGARGSGGVGDFIIPSPYFDVAIDVSSDEVFWVTDPGRHRLVSFDLEGALRAEWGSYSADVAGFAGCCNPTHIAQLPDGSFVTSEKGIPRVKLYSLTGRLLGIVAQPTDLARESDGLDLAVSRRGEVAVLLPRSRVVRYYRLARGKQSG